MAKTFESINEDQQAFIRAQHIFFVATAPLSEVGHINLSPKGYDCFRILSANKVAYMDVTGSGNETSAHLLENGRITLMFCAFDGPPNILRLYGSGHTVLPETTEWNELIGHFTVIPGSRQIIVVDIDRIQTSCGFAVPFFEYAGDRDALVKWAETKGEEGLVPYREQKNSRSIDTLPTPIGDHFAKRTE